MLKDFKTSRDVIAEAIWMHLWDNLFVITEKSPFGHVYEGCPWGRKGGCFKISVQLPAY